MEVGITGYTTKAHICRAILESIAFQTKAVLEAMRKDSGHELKQLNVSHAIFNANVRSTGDYHNLKK